MATQEFYSQLAKITGFPLQAKALLTLASLNMAKTDDLGAVETALKNATEAFLVEKISQGRQAHTVCHHRALLFLGVWCS